MVGASSNTARPSYFVATYLLSSSTDFDVYFVNPREREILGRPVYPSLADLPVTPDLVDVFRRPEDLPEVAQEAIAVGAKVFWAQLGLWSDEAAALAYGAGLDVVMNRCLKIEHARFHGGLHLAGFDTGVISCSTPTVAERRVRPWRSLLLLRHAKSAWPDGVADLERPLARRGERAAELVGRFLAGHGLVPDRVVSSPARRAAETAERVLAASTGLRRRPSRW